jgi:hypothetical protein
MLFLSLDQESIDIGLARLFNLCCFYSYVNYFTDTHTLGIFHGCA